MSETNVKSEAIVSEPVSLQILPEDKKTDIREKLWNFMEKNQISPIYSPFGKIPNFKDADAAGQLLTTLDVFKAATNIKIDPDKPLQAARFAVLKAGKTLLVPTPRHRPGLLTKFALPENSDDEILQKCANRQGAAEYSVHIELDEPIKIDLLVVGCVAVSPKGWRIGKGSGYSDLEYAMLVSNGVLSPSVPVVAIVHDSQIVDLADSLFDIHDVAVDYIVTPTRVVQCSGVKARPAGITWQLLAPERLDRLQILKRLRYREWKAIKDVRLSGEVEQPEELTDELPSNDKPAFPKRRNNYKKKPRKPKSSEPKSSEDEATGDVEERRTNKLAKDGEKSEEQRGRGGGRIRGGYNRRFRRRGGPRREGDSQRTLSAGENDREGESEHDEEREEGVRRRGTSGRGRRYGGPRGRGNRPRREVDSQAEEEEEVKDGEGNVKNRENGSGRRRRVRRSESDGGGASAEGDNQTEEGVRVRRRNNRPGGARPFYADCEGSVYVGSLPKSLRVSEFKAEVRDRKVQPLRVVWRGASGYAFLGFRTITDAEQALEALEGLNISEHNLRLEMAKSSGVRRRARGATRSGDSGGGDDHITSEDE